MNKRHVTVSGVRLKFASAHMATLGNELEPLHGHNYSCLLYTSPSPRD